MSKYLRLFKLGGKRTVSKYLRHHGHTHAHASGFLEHPDVNDWAPPPPPLDGNPSIWRSRIMSVLSQCAGVKIFTFHQCVYGQISRKPTRMVLLHMDHFAQETRLLGSHGYCNHEDKHESLLGLDAHGRFRSAPSKIYTSPTCALLSLLGVA